MMASMTEVMHAPIQFDGWTIYVETIEGAGERFCLPTRTAVVDPAGCGTEMAKAHVIAHLSLKHHLDSPDGEFTEDQEDAADCHARSMMSVARSLGAAAWALVAVNLITIQKVAVALAT